VGKSDGSVDGVRYFHTDPQRALFVKPDDFKILNNHNNNNHHH
jgi:dynactin complex subunit